MVHQSKIAIFEMETPLCRAFTRLARQTLEPSDHFHKMAPVGGSIIVFTNFFSGTDWKDVGNHFDVLHKHGGSSVSEGL